MAGVIAGISVASSIGYTQGSSAALLRVSMYEQEVNAVRSMYGLPPNFKVSRLAKERTMMEHGIHEALWEGVGNIAGFALIGKGMKVARKAGQKALSPSGKMAFASGMRDAYLRQLTRVG